MPGDLFNWQRKDWPSFSFARGALKDELAAFARAFRAAKAALREPQDPLFVARSLAAEAVTTSAIEGVEVVLRMFEDGETGAKAGLSAAKWTRMAKVSKPTATRDLAELVDVGAIVPAGDGPTTRYFLNHPAFVPGNEPIDGINDGINDKILRLVRNHPGRGVPFFLASIKASRATIERAVRALVRAGRIEHRGSRKTGGYYATQTSTP